MDRKLVANKKRLAKKAKRGFRGYPVGSLTYYGPDDSRASKLVAGIIEHDGGDVTEMRKWYSDHGDVRDSLKIAEEVVAFLDRFGVKSVVQPDRIIGCPHEEDIDYDGPTCPKCPFWANRDRWSGEIVH